MRILYSIFFCFISFLGISQELLPVQNFAATQYSAGNQNWMVTQDQNQNVFFANNAGLLAFNGERWKLHQMPNNSFLRSVKYIDGKLYCGSYMDFGFWDKNEEGNLKYTSLSKSLEEDFLDGEQFWHIENLQNYIVFQSLQRLYTFNKETQETSIISSEKGFRNLFKVNQSLYYQETNGGFFALKNSGKKQIINAQQLNNRLVVGLFEHQGFLHLVTRSDGIFALENQSLKQSNLLSKNIEESIYTALLVDENTLAFGTIGGGLLLADLPSGKITVYKQPQINNNTVLSLFHDESNNLWCGLDNGISTIALDSSVKIYQDTFGEIGTVYCSFLDGEDLYLGTNQGLYHKNTNAIEGFKLIEETNGQVWCIEKVNNQLLIGHDKGTFLVNPDQNSVTLIYNQSGTWTIIETSEGIFQGHYNGISFAPSKTEIKPEFQKMQGFNLSSRNLMMFNGDIWMGHDHKGVYRLSADFSKNKISVKKNFLLNKKQEVSSHVFKFDGQLYAATNRKIYQLNPANNLFTVDNELNEAFESKNRISKNIQVFNETNGWAFGNENIYQFSNDAFQNTININSFPIPTGIRNITNGFQNIYPLSENEFIIGSTEGYLTFKTPHTQKTLNELRIEEVKVSRKELEFSKVNLNKEDHNFHYKNNFLNFSFVLPNYNALDKVKYSHRLLGYNNRWSSWQTRSAVNYKNLPYGDYTFQVRGKINNQISDTETFDFAINRPWYISIWAIVVYVIVFLILIYITHYYYNRYYKVQQQKLIEENKKQLRIKEMTAKQEIMAVKNDQLKSEVESKNRELAASTMNMIKRNELLSDLKKQLEEASTGKDIDQIIKNINKNLSEKDNWKMFKEAFDNADKDFLQSVKSKHPNLTSNDLKLCAYLRLNLSSKEIAPLLHISVRSVEIKRYRLRKKMELEHEQGLVEYILTF